jgi:hypothetical protein
VRDMVGVQPLLARELWHCLEVVNAVTYFSPECRVPPGIGAGAPDQSVFCSLRTTSSDPSRSIWVSSVGR